MSERALREIYLPAFKAAIEERGSYTIMNAYNKFRGDWCSENTYVNRTLLREEMGFKGVTMTDWGGSQYSKGCFGWSRIWRWEPWWTITTSGFLPIR